MQHGRAVRIEHALGIARGARGVAQARGGVLVQFGPFKGIIAGSHQLVIKDQSRQRLGGFFIRPGHKHEVLEMLQLVADRGHQRDEGLVDKEYLVCGVVEDIDQLFRKKPRVDRMADEPRARCAKVDLQMPPVVPRDGAAARLCR